MVVVALIAGVAGIIVTLLVTSAIWALAMPGLSSVQDALRVGGLAWLGAQGVPVYVNAVAFSLAPWGIGLVGIALLVLGARRVTMRLGVSTGMDLAWLAIAVVLAAFAYAVLGAWVADISWRPDARAVGLDAAWRTGLVALVCLGAGAIAGLQRASDESEEPAHPLLPPMVVAVLRAGAVGLVAVLGVGAIAVSLSLLLHFDDAVTIQQSLVAGAGGGLGLALLSLAYAPVLAVWGASYVLGAGVVLAPGVTSTPFVPVMAPTSLPAVPVLAAIPQQASPLAWLLPVVVIACGLLVGLSVARAFRGSPRLLRAGLAVISAGVAGMGLGLVAALASGALGDQRLAYVGPMPVTVGVLGFVLLVFGAVPAAILGAERARGSHLAVAPVEDDAQDDTGSASDHVAPSDERLPSSHD